MANLKRILRRTKSKRGESMVEVLVAILIIAIIAVAVFSVATFSTKMTTTNNSEGSAAAVAQKTVEAMQEKVKADKNLPAVGALKTDNDFWKKVIVDNKKIDNSTFAYGTDTKEVNTEHTEVATELPAFFDTSESAPYIQYAFSKAGKDTYKYSGQDKSGNRLNEDSNAASTTGLCGSAELNVYRVDVCVKYFGTNNSSQFSRLHAYVTCTGTQKPSVLPASASPTA